MKLKLSICNFIRNITIFDYILFGMFTLFCFLLFSHVDIATTAQNSSSYLNGNILNFYSSCHDLNGGYGANYLPTTFIVYAIWNLPLKILSLIPEDWGAWSSIFTLWNKLLPTIVYFCCSLLIYKICTNRLKLSLNDSKIAVILFLSSPVGFYSQFIFGQYDIFTVLFMLIGIYFYFDISASVKSTYYFIGSFAIAITFKYFALLIFLVLLLLKEKSIWSIIKNSILVFFPTLLLGGIYYIFDYDAFSKSVLGFSALDYTQNGGIPIANFVNIQIAPVIVILILAFSYFTKCKNNSEFFSYSIHFCCGICFALFGLMKWHPQWLLFAVFFWNISFILHKQTSVFLWIDTIFGVIFNVFISITFADIADQSLLKNGILSSKLFYKDGINTTMADIYPFHSKDLCFSILFSIMLIYFIYSHPKFCIFSKNRTSPKLTGLIRSRFLICVLSFIIPALLCLPSIISQYNNLWQYRDDTSQRTSASFDEYGSFTQAVTLKGDSISKVELWVGTYGSELTQSSIKLTIKDSSQKVIASDTLDNMVIKEGTVLFDIGIVPITNGETYYFTFTASQGIGERLALFINHYEGDIDLPLRTYQRHYINNYVTATKKNIDTSIIDMKILGDK